MSVHNDLEDPSIPSHERTRVPIAPHDQWKKKQRKNHPRGEKMIGCTHNQWNLSKLFANCFDWLFFSKWILIGWLRATANAPPGDECFIKKIHPLGVGFKNLKMIGCAWEPIKFLKNNSELFWLATCVAVEIFKWNSKKNSPLSACAWGPRHAFSWHFCDARAPAQICDNRITNLQGFFSSIWYGLLLYVFFFENGYSCHYCLISCTHSHELFWYEILCCPPGSQPHIISGLVSACKNERLDENAREWTTGRECSRMACHAPISSLSFFKLNSLFFFLLILHKHGLLRGPIICCSHVCNYRIEIGNNFNATTTAAAAESTPSPSSKPTTCTTTTSNTTNSTCDSTHSAIEQLHRLSTPRLGIIINRTFRKHGFYCVVFIIRFVGVSFLSSNATLGVSRISDDNTKLNCLALGLSDVHSPVTNVFGKKGKTRMSATSQEKWQKSSQETDIQRAATRRGSHTHSLPHARIIWRGLACPSKVADVQKGNL